MSDFHICVPERMLCNYENNEDGKYVEGLKPEIAIVNEKQGNILDIIYGNCIFVSHDNKGDTIALTDEQMNVVMEELETTIELTNKDTFESFEVRALLRISRVLKIPIHQLFKED